MAVGRRAARAILIDDDGCLLLIKRTKPGRDPYWTAPGGGVDPEDVSLEAALRRELAEELGARVSGMTQVFLASSPSDAGPAIQHFFLTRLAVLDASARSGPEFADPSRGGYELDRVALDAVETVSLQPPELKDFITANRDALLADVASLG
jgi:ADP-ribose pyrophosphatase YjhB (NUDIX family)